MKKTIAAFALMLVGLAAPIAHAQAAPPAPAAGGLSGTLAGTGLTIGAGAGIVAGAIVIGVVVGNEDDATTSSSATTN